MIQPHPHPHCLPQRRPYAALAAYLLALCLSALLGSAALAQPKAWTPIGPDSATVLSAAHQPGNGAVMLAGTYFGGIYRSSNWGYTWAPVDGGFASSAVFALRFDERLPGRVFAGLFKDGVWRSDDAGLTWQQLSNGLTDGTVQALAIDPAASLHVLAATASGLFASNDAGLQWAPIASLAGVITRSIAFHPSTAGLVYVGSVGQGVFRSLDGGANWSAFAGGRALNTVNVLTFDQQGNLYAGTDSGVYQLAAGASAWQDLNFDLPANITIVHLVAHPTVANLLIAATAVGTYVISNWAVTPQWFLWSIEGSRHIALDSQGLIVHVAAQIGALRASTDFGRSWVKADRGMQTAFIGSLATGRSASGWALLAGSEAGVSSLEIGQSWKSVLRLTEGVFDLQFVGSRVYAGTETNGVSRSLDAGSSWADASRGIVPTRVSDLSFSVGSAPTLLAATGAGAYRSTDSGANWTPIRLTEVSYVLSVAADPVRPPIVWLGAGQGRVYRSIDSGIHFNFAGNGLPVEDIVQLLHAPWSAVYALTASGTLYTTLNDGASWFPTASPCGSAAVALQLDPTQPWVLYAATRGSGVCKSESRGLAWRTVNTGINQSAITALLLDPRNPQQLWAGAAGQIFHSVDGGAHWTAQTSGLPSAAVTALALDPLLSSHLYAIAYNGGLYESSDSGNNWRLRSSASAATAALTLRPHPSQSGRLLTGTVNAGLQTSLDSGQTWGPSNAGMSLFVRSIAADAGAPTTLYAATLGGGVFRSLDGADSWTNIALSSGSIFRLRSPAPARVLVGTSYGVGESRDAGNTWFTLGQSDSYAMSLVADPADARRVMIGGIGGQVWLGDASGARWQAVGGGLPALEVQALTTCPDGTVWAAPERAGVWRSSFGSPGVWTHPGSVGLADAQVRTLSCDPRSGLLYAGTNGLGVWLSLNQGASWIAVNNGLTGTVMSQVLASPTTAWQVWAAVAGGAVYRSDDGGQRWSAVASGLPAGGVGLLTIGPDGVLYASANGGVFRLASGSSAWVAASSGLSAGALSLLWADPSRAGFVMAAVGGKQLFTSTDAGVSWRAARTDAASAAMTTAAGASASSSAGSNAARLYVGTVGTGVVWSDDAGASFSAVQTPDSVPQVVLDIAVDAVDAQTLYLASGGQGVLVSRDGGAHWRLANNGLSHAGSLEVLCIARHPSRSGELYAGTRAGVYLSRDSGSSWTAINSGLVNKNATALHFDSVVADTLYVGIEGGGVWYYDTRP